MESRLGAIGRAIQAFSLEAFDRTWRKPGQAFSATIAVTENSVQAIHAATISLVKSLLETYAIQPGALLCTFFLTDLTADYPARAAREAFGWDTIPLLCAYEASAAPNGQHSISVILVTQAEHSSIHPSNATQPRLYGIRGATILDEPTEEAMRAELRWLLDELCAQNRLELAAVDRVILTITPDLNADAARNATRAVLGPSLPVFIANEIDVPGAPRRCLRALLFAQSDHETRPVYSERARQLLRPDLSKPVPQTVRIIPSGPLHGDITLPSSKYHTLRTILAALLAEGESIIDNPAQSDDTTVLLKACEQLGATIATSYHADGHCTLRIRGVSGQIKPAQNTVIDVGNAGAVLRLLLGICASSPMPVTFTTPYPESLGHRPNDDLLQALAQLGVPISSQGPDGTLPITIGSASLRGGTVQLSGKKSSQYLSALLYLGPLLDKGLSIEITDTLTSASFIDLTLEVLHQAGISIVTQERYRRYLITGKQRYAPRTYHIPGDYPSAAALLAAVAIAGGEITLRGLEPGAADGEATLAAFAQMGLEVNRSGTSITARAERPLRGITLDGNTAIDSVPCIAAAACFAAETSVITNIANLRLKESDRIYDLAGALQATGCQIMPFPDRLEIQPASRIEGNVAVDAHADHRLAQALAVVGLGSVHAVTLRHVGHVAKSYPHFFDDLSHLGAKV
ncbi:MAG TPA: 3-phosphoshikimate 1-carboxyvinyltransferase, partial [Ktedonobacterales bacterium]|nr:3-phosphoshikimate 1-carboxyvinyltransferase [Ktedonobacterales bacterium]